MVQFYKQMIEEYGKDIIVWSKKFWQYNDDIIEEQPDGEFPIGEELSKDDESTVIEIGKYSITSIGLYIIEFDLLKNHQEIVADYYKRLGIPQAAKYAKDMIAFYKEVFTLGIQILMIEGCFVTAPFMLYKKIGILILSYRFWLNSCLIIEVL